MKGFFCSVCGSPRFLLYEMDNGVIEARCVICERVVRLKKIEEVEVKG